MKAIVSYCALLVLAGVVLCVASATPWVLSDDNDFLKGFVNHEFLNVLGVILAITIASVAQLHLTFNDIEQKANQPGRLQKYRAKTHQAAYWLLGLFMVAVVVVVVKPIVACDPWSEALFNGAALVILLWNTLILINIVQTAFAIKP